MPTIQPRQAIVFKVNRKTSARALDAQTQKAKVKNVRKFTSLRKTLILLAKQGCSEAS